MDREFFIYKKIDPALFAVALVLCFPITAKGSQALQTVRTKAADYFPARCPERDPEARGNESEQQAQHQVAAQEKAQGCVTFLEDLNGVIATMEAREGADNEAMSKAREIIEESQTSQILSASRCQSAANDASALRQRTTQVQNILGEALGRVRFRIKPNREAKESIIQDIRNATILSEQSTSVIGQVASRCEAAGHNMGSLRGSNGSGGDDTMRQLQMAQMGMGALNTLGQMMKGDDKKGGGGGGNDSDGDGIPDSQKKRTGGGGSGGIDSDGDGIPDAQEKESNIANGTGGGQVGFVAAQSLDPPADATIAGPAASSSGSIPNASEPDSRFDLPQGNATASAGSPAPPSGAGGGSGALGGASRAPAAKEAGATASNSSEGSERSGGGGKTGGGGGSSFLGLGGEGGGLGDILGGIKNPFETPAAVADGGTLNFGLPPAADPLKLASAKEINVNAIAKDSVFAAVKTAIQRQRERGNTR